MSQNEVQAVSGQPEPSNPAKSILLVQKSGQKPDFFLFIFWGALIDHSHHSILFHADTQSCLFRTGCQFLEAQKAIKK